MIVFEPVQAAIWHCVNHYAHSDATFLAERLYAEVPSEEALYLLATCYYRAGQVSMAHAVLNKKNTSSPKGRYLLAKCCVELSNIPDAERVLKSDVFLRNKEIKEEEVISEFGEMACFVLQLLGICASKTQRPEVAIRCFEKSLKLNPFLWNSFEQICNLGGVMAPEEAFSLNKIDNFKCCHGVNPVVSLVNQEYNRQSLQKNLDAPFKKTPVQVNAGNGGTCAVRLFVTPEESAPISVPMTPNSLGIAHLSNLSSMKPRKTRLRTMLSPLQLPSFGLLPFNKEAKTPETTMLSSPEIIHRPTRRVLMKETPLQQSLFQSGNTDAGSPPRPTVRRSTRLFSNSVSVKENNKSPKLGKFASPKSPSRKSKRAAATKTLPSFNEVVVNNEKNKSPAPIIEESVDQLSGQAVQIQKDSAEGLMTLFREIGSAMQYLAKYDCKKAIEVFNNLPPTHYNTGWVQGMIGKAHFEVAEYPNSVTHFRRMRELDPMRVGMCEVFSSALWFLQREVELSALSQHLVTHARTAPHTWCVAANCFSLHKEHETAIKFLHRAVQMDPDYGYAFTLLGHEYLASEELDKAMTCFRNAIRISSRDYSAYFGLGSVYSKQEKFELAQVHFSMAENINPKNVTILCHLGVVENAQSRPTLALQWLDKALAIDPKNPLGKFQKATVYAGLCRHGEALQELQELRLIVPKESSVEYLMGKIYKKQGDTDKALMHFNWAMDLDPKGVNNQIKESVDSNLPRAADADAEADVSVAEPEAAHADQQEPESDGSF